MSKNSHYEGIIELIKEGPKSQMEIRESIGKDKIKVQGVARYLKRGIRRGSIAYLGNKVNKKDARLLLKYYYNIQWPENAHQCYIYTPQTEKFYKHLKRRKVADIKGVLQLYRTLEISAMFQKIFYENLKVLKADFKGRGQNLTDKELKKKIARKRKEIKEFYDSRAKKDPVLKFLQFTPLMHWCAFKRLIPIDSPEYSSKKDIVKNITNHLIKLKFQKNI